MSPTESCNWSKHTPLYKNKQNEIFQIINYYYYYYYYYYYSNHLILVTFKSRVTGRQPFRIFLQKAAVYHRVSGKKINTLEILNTLHLKSVFNRWLDIIVQLSWILKFWANYKHIFFANINKNISHLLLNKKELFCCFNQKSILLKH